MNTKDLNALDGDAMLKEVLAEIVEKDRRLYKNAIKNAVVRNKQAQKSADKSQDRADKTQKTLDDLVSGGMEGFLAADSEDDELGSLDDLRTYRPFNKRTIH